MNSRAKVLAKKRTAPDIADLLNERLGGASSPFKAEGSSFQKKPKLVPGTKYPKGVPKKKGKAVKGGKKK
jgi:hypothetical protein